MRCESGVADTRSDPTHNRSASQVGKFDEGGHMGNFGEREHARGDHRMAGLDRRCTATRFWSSNTAST